MKGEEVEKNRVVNLIAIGLIAIFAVSAVPGQAAAQDTKSVKARQELMKGNSSHMKTVVGFVKNGKGSAADAEKALLSIAADSKKIPDLFPKGTDSDKLGLKVTGAKPAIWAEFDTFKKDAAHLGSEARKFAAVVKSGDKGAMAKELGSFGKDTCGACHRQFRAKREK